MTAYFVRRIRFRNGERTSLLLNRATGSPVHEVALYVGTSLRATGRAAATIHQALRALALLYNELHRADVSLMTRLAAGRFLTLQEIIRISEAARYRIDREAEDTPEVTKNRKVVSLEKIRLSHRAAKEEPSLDAATTATRLGQIQQFLTFAVDYVASQKPPEEADALKAQAHIGLCAIKARVPRVANRSQVGARQGIDEETEQLLLDVIRPGSPNNPWKSAFVQKRNALIIKLELATGMRRGELLGLRISDLNKHKPLILIARRADAQQDTRIDQPSTKTYDREIEVTPSIMQELWRFINEDRRAIKAARKHEYIIVSDEGAPLTLDSVNKIFRQLRKACPLLPKTLTSHVLRHTWNDRFSEIADEMGLSPEIEQKARANQQGWSETSDTAGTYNRRHTQKAARKATLQLQEDLEKKVNDANI
jgi:integrase